MPIYEFICNHCGEESEILVPRQNWEGVKCPHCGSTKMEKKLSLFSSSSQGDSPCGGDSCPNPERRQRHGGGCCGGCCCHHHH